MASRLFAVDLDLGLNKAKRFVFEDFATNPSTDLAAGRVIFWTANDSDDNHLKVYDGDSWEVLAYKSDLSDSNTTYSVSAETATGGANLRLTGSDASTDNVKFAGTGGITITRTDADTITIDGGSVVDTNTTYSISAETATGGANLRLTDSDAVTDNVKIAGGTNVTVTRTDADTITIDATDTNTTYTAGGGLALDGTTFSHADTSSQSSVDNSGLTVVQDITLDTYGHITAIGSTTIDIGVASVAGTTNEIEVSGTGSGPYTGAVTIGLPDNVTVTGDLAVNGGDITTTAGTATIFNTNATTLTIGGAATTLNLGAASGTTTVKNSLVVDGDLTVNGDVTTVNTATLAVEDNIVLLNNGVTGTPTLDSGIEVERGDYTNAKFYWNETANLWYTATPADDANAAATHAVVRKYAVDLDANNETSAGVFSIAHGLGTKDVTVQVYSLTSPYAQVEVAVEHTSTSAVTLTFNTDPGDDNYRVVVTG